MTDEHPLSCERGGYARCEPGHEDPAERIIVAGLDGLIDHKAYRDHWRAAAWLRQIRATVYLLAVPTGRPEMTRELPPAGDHTMIPVAGGCPVCQLRIIEVPSGQSVQITRTIEPNTDGVYGVLFHHAWCPEWLGPEYVPREVELWHAYLYCDGKGRVVSASPPDRVMTELAVGATEPPSPRVEKTISLKKVVLKLTGFPDEESILAEMAKQRAECHRPVRKMGRIS